MRSKKESFPLLTATEIPCYNGLVSGRPPACESDIAEEQVCQPFCSKTTLRLAQGRRPKRARGIDSLTPTFSANGTSYVSAEQIEDVVRQLKDVVSVRALVGVAGAIEELHVLVSARRPPKQITRDIESALVAHLGLRIDYKKISIAQAHPRSSFPISGSAVAVSQMQGASKSRLRFADVSLTIQGTRAEAVVHLTREDQVFKGSSTGHASSHNQLRLIATAAIRAVENKEGEDGTMVVEDVCANVALAGQTAVVVLVSAIADRGEEHLTGCALVRQDLWKAVASATLDAVNRRMAAQTSFEEDFA